MFALGTPRRSVTVAGLFPPLGLHLAERAGRGFGFTQVRPDCRQILGASPVSVAMSRGVVRLAGTVPGLQAAESSQHVDFVAFVKINNTMNAMHRGQCRSRPGAADEPVRLQTRDRRQPGAAEYFQQCRRHGERFAELSNPASLAGSTGTRASAGYRARQIANRCIQVRLLSQRAERSGSPAVAPPPAAELANPRDDRRPFGGSVDARGFGRHLFGLEPFEHEFPPAGVFAAAVTVASRLRSSSAFGYRDPWRSQYCLRTVARLENCCSSESAAGARHDPPPSSAAIWRRLDFRPKRSQATRAVRPMMEQQARNRISEHWVSLVQLTASSGRSVA